MADVDVDRALRRLYPDGGTAMGRWLLLARDLVASRPHAIAHAILLTDGKNESESADALATAVRACAGRFQCDCRGVGTEWDVTEVRTIAEHLLGTVDLVARPEQLVDDFRTMAHAASGKDVDGVALRVWTPAGASIRSLHQVTPHISALTELARPVDGLTADFPTGAWTGETRHYHLVVDLPPRAVGTEMAAARVALVVGDRVITKSTLPVAWTEDLELSTRVVPEVAHFTGQARLLDAVRAGIAARTRGDEGAATQSFGLAARLAFETGNDDTLRLLARVVEIDDAPTGTVRPRADVDAEDVFALDTRSTRTARLPHADPVG